MVYSSPLFKEAMIFGKAIDVQLGKSKKNWVNLCLYRVTMMEIRHYQARSKYSMIFQVYLESLMDAKKIKYIAMYLNV